MKKEIRERKSTYDVFIANDGTEFSTREQCEEYEKSAKGVIKGRYANLVVAESDEYCFFGAGSEENQIDVVKIKSQEDADVVAQMILHVNGDPELNEDQKNKMQRALDEDDVLVLRWTYEKDWLYIVNTRDGIIEHMQQYGVEEESAE